MQTVQETPTRTKTDAVVPQIQTINLQNLAADLTPAGGRVEKCLNFAETFSD